MFTYIHRLTNNKQQQADLHKKYHILDWIKFMTTIITCSPTPTLKDLSLYTLCTEEHMVTTVLPPPLVAKAVHMDHHQADLLVVLPGLYGFSLALQQCTILCVPLLMLFNLLQ